MTKILKRTGAQPYATPLQATEATMKDKLLSIGEVSKLKGVGIKSLRYYERIGIFNPAYINPETGYRYYSMTQMMELDVIITCIELGIPLKDLESYRKLSGALDLEAMLERGRASAIKRKRQAQAILLQTETYLNEIHEQRQLHSANGNPQVRNRSESLALALPLAGPEGLGIRAYVHAIARLYYRFELGSDLVPLYKQGIMKDPCRLTAASSGASATPGEAGEHPTQSPAGWEVYLEMQILDEDNQQAVRRRVSEALLGTGMRLASIPAGIYNRTLVEGSGYEATFTSAREQGASLEGLVLVSDMWKGEVDPETSSFEVLELQSEDAR